MSLPDKKLPAITQEQLRAFGEAAGDPNPIHLDEAVAKKMGLPGVIAHGMLIASFLSERALEIAEEKGAFELSQFQVRFKGMTLLGDELTIAGAIKEASEYDLCLELSARNQRDEVVTLATAGFRKSA